jgi:hypothetical protein
VSSVLGNCLKCGEPIRSLDGAGSVGGRGFTHGDCERAATIDYGIAFDIAYQLACDLGYVLHAFMEESAGDDEFEEKYDRYLTDAVSRAADMTAWRTYALARKGGVPDAV